MKITYDTASSSFLWGYDNPNAIKGGYMGELRPLRFMETDSGCFVCISHRTNDRGYVAIGSGPEREGLHRVIWKINHRDIPKGFEVDHICGNPTCANVKHMQCVPVVDHRAITQERRSGDDRNAALFLRGLMGFTARDTSELLGRGVQSIRKWTRDLSLPVNAAEKCQRSLKSEQSKQVKRKASTASPIPVSELINSWIDAPHEARKAIGRQLEARKYFLIDDGAGARWSIKPKKDQPQQ